MTRLHRTFAAVGCILPLVLAVPARAQSTTTPPPAPIPHSNKWTVEWHGGFLRGSKPSGGSGQIPPYAGSFPTTSGEMSPAVSSWYFGDGARWLNYYGSAISSLDQVKALDSALTSAAVQRQRGPSWGVRVTRQLGNHYDWEFAVDQGQGSNVLSASAFAALQNGTTTFQTAWRGLLSGLPSSSVSSKLAVSDDVGRQVFATTAIDFVFGEHRWVRYVSLGGGLAINSGTPTAALTGTAGFAINGLSALQTDAVTIRYVEPHIQPVGTFGLGLMYYWTRRSGFRFDGRVYVRRNSSHTIVSTNPSTTGSPTAETLLNPASVPLQFSAAAGVPSTLSQALTNVQAYSGAGAYSQLAFTIGYFFRF